MNDGEDDSSSDTSKLEKSEESSLVEPFAIPSEDDNTSESLKIPVKTTPAPPALAAVANHTPKAGKGKTRFVFTLLLLIILCAVAAAFYYQKHHQNTTSLSNNHKSSSTSTKSSTTTNTSNNLLLFVSFVPGQNESNSESALLYPNGSVFKQYGGVSSEDNFWPTDQLGINSSGVLLSNEVANNGTTDYEDPAMPNNIGRYQSSWAGLNNAGQIQPITNASNFKSAFIDMNDLQTNVSGYSMVGNDSIIINNDNAGEVEQFNLSNGTAQTLITYACIKGATCNGHLITNGQLNTSDTSLSFITDNAVINSQSVPGYALLVYNLSTDQISSITNLPGDIAYNDYGLVLSNDNSLIGYMNFNSKDFINIYDISTNHNLALSNGVVNDISSVVQFSPDNKYLLVEGTQVVSSTQDNNIIQIYSTTSGAIVKSIDVGNTSATTINFAGWDGNDTFVYSVCVPNNTTTHSANFGITDLDTSGASVTQVNLATDTSSVFPQTYGALYAILNTTTQQ